MDFDGAEASIDVFVSKWQRSMRKYCKNKQKEAVFYLWLQFFLVLRSLRCLAKSNQIMGCLILARSCLECDVSIAAIINDESLGDDYMGYGAHARKKYLEAQGIEQDICGYSDLLKQMLASASAIPPERARGQWYPRNLGFKGLCDRAERAEDYALYIAFCQNAHATIAGRDILNTCGFTGEHESGDMSKTLLSEFAGRFVGTTRCVLDLVFGEMWTQDKEACVSDFEDHVQVVRDS